MPSHSPLSRPALAAAALACALPWAAAAPAQEAKTLFGFTPFPYDFTQEAVDRTHDIVVQNSSIYAVHIDDPVPWREALADAPFPAAMERKWNDMARAVPATHPVYLGLSPVGKDRVGIAPGMDRDGNENARDAFSSHKFGDDEVKRAYLNYVRRAVRLFKPRYLNVGIEAGEMAARKPGRWPEFESLFDYVKAGIKREFPDVMVGVSFGLQSMRKPDVAQRVKPLAERSDYVCLSFYPYASGFSEKFGAPPLPAGKAAWREPLAWIAAYTKKPVAICETGYSTQNVELKQFDLKLRGDTAGQAEYVADLVDIAKRENFLFVIWFLAVDYDKLYAKMPPGSEVNLLWRNIGLFDGEVRPKPAFEAWKGFRAAGVQAKAGGPAPAAPAAPAPAAPAPAPGGGAPASLMGLKFDASTDLFICPGDTVKLDPAAGGRPAMRWEYASSSGQWKWCAKDIGGKPLAAAQYLDFQLRSDSEGPLFLKLEEKDKEAFYAIVTPSKEWTPVTLRLADLAIDKETEQNGKLDMGNIATIILADPGGDTPTGRRTLWIGDLHFR